MAKRESPCRRNQQTVAHISASTGCMYSQRQEDVSGSDEGRTIGVSSAGVEEDDVRDPGMGATRFLIVTLRNMIDVSVSPVSLRLVSSRDPDLRDAE